jgi:hypothetical protein
MTFLGTLNPNYKLRVVINIINLEITGISLIFIWIIFGIN